MKGNKNERETRGNERALENVFWQIELFNQWYTYLIPKIKDDNNGKTFRKKK